MMALSNYGLISVLTVLAGVFEKLIYNQLYDYLKENEHLFSNQFGFRALHSVVTCLLTTTDILYVNMANCRYTANIFIDLKKTFDTLDLGVLCTKVKLYGVDNLELKWFSSYLTNRKLLCKVNGVYSKTEDFGFSVPQGSCFGPFLFLIYINNLPFSLKECRVIIHADDTNTSYSSMSHEGITQTLNYELSLLEQ